MFLKNVQNASVPELQFCSARSPVRKPARFEVMQRLEVDEGLGDVRAHARTNRCRVDRRAEEIVASGFEALGARAVGGGI